MVRFGLTASSHARGPALLRGAWTQENYAQLLKFFERADAIRGRKAAVFDFDNTSIFNDIGDASFYYLVDEALLDFPKILSSPGLWEAFSSIGVNPARSSVEEFWRQRRQEPKKPPQGLRAWGFYRKALYQAYDELCRLKGKEVSYRWVIEIMAGKSPKEVRHISRRALDRELARPLGQGAVGAGAEDSSPAMIAVGIRPYAEIKNLMEVLKKKDF